MLNMARGSTHSEEQDMPSPSLCSTESNTRGNTRNNFYKEWFPIAFRKRRWCVFHDEEVKSQRCNVPYIRAHNKDELTILSNFGVFMHRTL